MLTNQGEPETALFHVYFGKTHLQTGPPKREHLTPFAVCGPRPAAPASSLPTLTPSRPPSPRSVLTGFSAPDFTESSLGSGGPGHCERLILVHYP